MKDEIDAALRRAEEKVASLEAAITNRGVALNALLVRALLLEEKRQRAQQALERELLHLPAPDPGTQ